MTKRRFKLLVTLNLLFGLGSCATMAGDLYQPISVLAVCAGSNKPVEALCTLKNSQNSISVSSPGVARVRKSYEDIHISCSRKGNARSDVIKDARPQGGIAGNLIIGGLVGAAVDLGSGAAFRYPTTATVIIRCDNNSHSTAHWSGQDSL